ncbi:hypothetical protein AgCh_015584 [Apium graveolens]
MGLILRKKSKAIDAKKAIEKLQANDEMLINIKEQDDDFRLLTPQELQEEAEQPPDHPVQQLQRQNVVVKQSSSEGCHGNLDIVPLGVHIRRNSDNKEIVVALKKVENVKNADKENTELNIGPVAVAKKVSTEKFHKKPRALKPTSL